MGEGVPIALAATGIGGDGAPRQSLPVPAVLVPRSTGLRDPFFLVSVLTEDESPRQLFLSKLMLEDS